MVISRTPYRISLFGGGTDYPAWYLKHGGTVLATSIDKYCYITARYLPPFFEHRYRVVYSRSETCLNIADIQHPAVRSVLQYMKFDRGLEIHHDGDLPARSGVGSSSSFVVGMLNSLHALRGSLRSKQELMMESIYVEQNLLKEQVGSQDQALAAYGGFNVVRFHQNGEITVCPLPIPVSRSRELKRSLLLYFTGQQRFSSEVAASYISSISDKEQEMQRYMTMVNQACQIIQSSSSLNDLGLLLHEAWQIKRSLSSIVSNSSIDQTYTRAIEAGALGGKLIGAGGGGFLLFFVPPENKKSVRTALSDLLEIPFNFESHGSQILFIDREIDYTHAEQRRFIREHAQEDHQ